MPYLSWIPCVPSQFSYTLFLNFASSNNKGYNLKYEADMYIENNEFREWMQKLYDKLEELCKDIRVLRNADRVLPENDNLLDNQDLCLLFKVSIKTLQRYRAIGVLRQLEKHCTKKE